MVTPTVREPCLSLHVHRTILSTFQPQTRSCTIFFLFLLLPEVVKTTVLLADMNDFTSVNDVYKQCEYQ